MSILIVFATITGTTQNCANKIKAVIHDSAVDIVDVKNIKNLDPKKYDTIVLGSSIYMGRINRKMRKFITKNQEMLLNKQLHFFICGMARGEEGIKFLKAQIDEKLFEHAKQVQQLGFELHLEKMNLLYRTIVKKIVEETKPIVGLDEEGIASFAKMIEISINMESTKI